MSAEFRRPTLFGGRQFDALAHADNPAAVVRAAHESAAALLARVRGAEDPAVVDRVVRYTDEHGIDTLAELWARSASDSLPGALWRLFLIRAMIRNDAHSVSLAFSRGTARLATIDEVVVGVPAPAGPDEIVELADRILHGVFVGDLSLALDRAAAFCRLAGNGFASLAEDAEATEPERAAEHDRRALRLVRTAEELHLCARLAHDGALD